MPKEGKVIITAAITGGVHVPAQSPHLPITPDEIVDECVRAGEAGAAVAHIHVRDPKTGQPIPSLALFRDVAERVKQRSDIVLCTTTGGSPGMTHAERIGVVRELSPELATCNMGSMNFALFPLMNRLKEYRFDWEQPFLERTDDNIFANTFKSMRYFLETMNETGTRPELEIYDAGMVNNTAFMVNAGVRTRHPRRFARHRGESGVFVQPGAYAPGGIRVVGCRRRAVSVSHRRGGTGDGRQCAGRAGRQRLSR